MKKYIVAFMFLFTALPTITFAVKPCPIKACSVPAGSWACGYCQGCEKAGGTASTVSNEDGSGTLKCETIPGNDVFQPDSEFSKIMERSTKSKTVPYKNKIKKSSI